MPPEHAHYLFLENLQRSTNYPQPREVVRAALAEIVSDGTILEYDETGQMLVIEAYDHKSLDRMPEDVYAREMHRLRGAIEGTLIGVVHEPANTEWELKKLAHRLSAYIH